jgi:hypothetical protein
MGLKPKEDQHAYIPDDIWLALGLYASAERKRMNNPILSPLITEKSLAVHILRNAVQKQGFYKGVGGKGK